MNRKLGNLALMTAMMLSAAENESLVFGTPRRRRVSENKSTAAPIMPRDKYQERPKHVFSIKGQKIEAYSRKDAIKRYNRQNKK